MKPFHINVGHIFSQPYESVYSMIRRCLSANPGIPWSTINNNLRSNDRESFSSTGRLLSRQLKPDNVKQQYYLSHFSYTRQCPKCAQQLYHTDIFALPWLSQCPIHHCDLTTECPVCHLSWPDINGITKRNCPSCGIISLKLMHKSILSDINNQNYQPIADIFDLLETDPHEHFSIYTFYHDDDDSIDDSWMRVPISSARYPSYQINISDQFSADNLLSLNIDQYQISCMTTELSPLSREELNARQIIQKYPIRWHREIKQDVLKTAHNRVIDDFTVMRQVVGWILRNAPDDHPINLSSYRFMGVRDFIYSQDPCPFCLAFSLWFFHLAASHYGNSTTDMIDDYPFLEETGFGRLFNYGEPHVAVDSVYYKTSPTFSAWLYRRGLVVSFLDLLYFAYRFIKQLNSYREVKDKYIYISPCTRIESHYHYYLADIENNCFKYYYEGEDLLKIYSADNLPFSSISSLNHQYPPELFSRDANTIKFPAISNRRFSYSTFLSLHNTFSLYLDELVQYEKKYNNRLAPKSDILSEASSEHLRYCIFY